jgi:hypothetical protein
MIHILKSDRWLGYAALVCAVVVTLLGWLDAYLSRGQSALVVIPIYCLSPLGAYLAIRGLFGGSVSNRVCAGLALLFFVWIAYSLIMALNAAKIR